MDSSADYLTLKQNAASGSRLRPGWSHPGGPHGHWKSLNLLHSYATGERQWGCRQRRPFAVDKTGVLREGQRAAVIGWVIRRKRRRKKGA